MARRAEHAVLFSAFLGVGLAACASTEGSQSPGAGGAAAASGAGGPSAGLGGSGGTSGAAGAVSGGSAGAVSGGAAGSGASGASGTSGTSGSGAGGSGAGSGAAGSSGTGGSGDAGSPGTGCSTPWSASDPALPGPYATVTETNVGPAAGVGADGGPPVAFTLFRPMELGTDGLCHPVVTWGNGTGSSPTLYRTFLNHLASHGFVVIASDSPNVAQGSPPPMVAGVTWVIEQNADPSSVLYQRIDTQHVGATGHSQGGLATTTAGGDSQVTTIAPLCGAGSQRNLHGPALFFCGGEDTVATCANIERAFDAVSGLPAMFANYLTADHADWITFRGTAPSAVEIAVTAWMRVHLMGDASLRSWFYGPDCRLCTDPAWQVAQKMMDQ